MRLSDETMAGVDPRAAADYLQRVSPAVSAERIEALDRNIRIWLDRDDIATWIAVATAAGYSVDTIPRSAHPHGLTPDTGD